MVAGDLEAVKLVSDVLANAMTIVALAVGAVWAVWAFQRERTRWPKANLELVVSHRELTAEQTLIHVKLKINNAGRGLMKLTMLRADVSQVLPLPDETAEALRDGSLINRGTWAAEWPTRQENHHERYWPGETQEPEPRIEPGENDEFRSDFLVPSNWERVYVYVYVANEALKGRDELGWTVTSYYDLTGEEDGESTRNLVPTEAA